MNKIKVLIQYIGITLLLMFVTIVILMFFNIIFTFMNIPILIAKNVSESIAYILGFLLIKKKFKNIKVKEHISISSLNFKMIVSIIIFFSSLTIVYNNIFVWIILRLELSPNIINYIFGSFTLEYKSISALILGLFSIAFITPIIEELYFRVFAIEFLKKRYSIITSIIISSLVFSIIHFSKIQDSIEIFITAVIITIIYTKTDNAVYCIVAHITHNAQYILFNYCICNNILIFNQDVVAKVNNCQAFSNNLYIFSLVLFIGSYICLNKQIY